MRMRSRHKHKRMHRSHRHRERKKLEEYLEILWYMHERHGTNLKKFMIDENFSWDPTIAEELKEMGYIEQNEIELKFTDKGYDKARQLVRSHRLAERLLIDVLNMKLDHAETGACECPRGYRPGRNGSCAVECPEGFQTDADGVGSLELPPGDYYALVRRGWRRRRASVYAWTLHDKMPPIPIPLQKDEPEPTLDLQSAFDLSYDRAAYQDSLDYSHALQPSAREEDAGWLKELLPAK